MQIMKLIALLLLFLSGFVVADKPPSIQYKDTVYKVDEREWQEALLLSKGQVIAGNTAGDDYTSAQLKALQYEQALRSISAKKARLIVLFENGVIPEVYSYNRLTELGNDRGAFSPSNVSYGPKSMPNSHFEAYFLSTKENQLKRRFQNALSMSEIEQYYRTHKSSMFPVIYDYVVSHVDLDSDADVTAVLADYESHKQQLTQLLVQNRKSDEIPWGSALAKLKTMTVGQLGHIQNDYFANRVFRLEQKQLKQIPSLEEASGYLKSVIATKQLKSEISAVLAKLSIR